MTFTYLVGLDNDVVSLTTVDVEVLSLVWHDWSEIGADDGHHVVVNVHNEGSLDSTVEILANNSLQDNRFSYLLMNRNMCFLPGWKYQRADSPVVALRLVFLPFRR